MSERADSSSPGDQLGDSLSAAEANRLWETYRSGTGPEAKGALDRLYRALRRPLVEFCRLKGCDAELADEVAETAWAHLMSRKPQARRSFIALLRKTAQNLSYKARKARGHNQLSHFHGPEPADPAELAQRSETVQAVQDCLATLDPEDRAFLTYVHSHGLTQRAACELLGWRISASTSHQRLMRIREQLAECLKKKGIS